VECQIAQRRERGQIRWQGCCRVGVGEAEILYIVECCAAVEGDRAIDVIRLIKNDISAAAVLGQCEDTRGGGRLRDATGLSDVTVCGEIQIAGAHGRSAYHKSAAVDQRYRVIAGVV